MAEWFHNLLHLLIHNLCQTKKSYGRLFDIRKYINIYCISQYMSACANVWVPIMLLLLVCIVFGVCLSWLWTIFMFQFNFIFFRLGRFFYCINFHSIFIIYASFCTVISIAVFILEISLFAFCPLMKINHDILSKNSEKVGIRRQFLA